MARARPWRNLMVAGIVMGGPVSPVTCGFLA
jgi:hypothetical protein